MTKRAVVTGVLSGLGEATAERLAADGLDVIGIDVAPGADYVVDVSNVDEVASFAEAVGVIDVLVNSAGIAGPNALLVDVEMEDWKHTFDVNVHGTFAMCRALAPGMVAGGWGRIVSIASIAGKEGNPNLSAYSASKAAVIGMTKSLGKELATAGVLVNAVAPAVVETPMNAHLAPDVLERLTSLIPMKRLGQASEVAALVAWLASDECSFSTGSVYDITGGRATY